jgi:hypothetical protein
MNNWNFQAGRVTRATPILVVRLHKTIAAIILLAVFHPSARPATVTVGAARLIYEGVEQPEAIALGRTVSAARKVLVDQFGFDLPKRILLHVQCGPRETPQLRTDGLNQIWLSLQRRQQLQRPTVSEIFTLYGLCHELGHLAMYRALRHRDWLSSDAAEGWAHWVGSVVVDELYRTEGRALWPDPYDYSRDGTARLRSQLAASEPNAVTRAAGHWWRLEERIGRKRMGAVFRAWEAAGIDATQPVSAVVDALVNTVPASKHALEAWAQAALPLLVEPAKASEFQAQQVPAACLAGQSVRLGYGDGSPDGKTSIGTIAHLICFEAPDSGIWYVRRVSVYGDRYGSRRASDKYFELTLCDRECQRIALWTKPYGAFLRGEPKWVHFDLVPTQVPRAFCLSLHFRPTESDGVHVAWDTGSNGHSGVGIPGKCVTPFQAGDWLVRVELDQQASR